MFWSVLTITTLDLTFINTMADGRTGYQCIMQENVISVLFSFKKLIQVLECSWNHEYFGSLAK